MLHFIPQPQDAPASSATIEDLQFSENKKESSLQPFSTYFQELSSKLFSFNAQNMQDGLSCSFLLDIQDIIMSENATSHKKNPLASVLICDFPSINTRILQERFSGEEYLQEILIARFHLNLLEALFLFCIKHNVEMLALNMNDHSVDAFEIYGNFPQINIQMTTEKEEQTQFLISINANTYSELLNYIRKLDHHFQQTLWRCQKESPIIRQYLKKAIIL